MGEDPHPVLVARRLILPRAVWERVVERATELERAPADVVAELLERGLDLFVLEAGRPVPS